MKRRLKGTGRPAAQHALEDVLSDGQTAHHLANLEGERISLPVPSDTMRALSARLSISLLSLLGRLVLSFVACPPSQCPTSVLGNAQ